MSAHIDLPKSVSSLLLALVLASPVQASIGPAETAPKAAPAIEEGAKKAKAKDPYKNTIKWATASEVDNFGFDVMRGDAEEGPFAKLNEVPIEGGGTTDSPRKYQFVDDTIDPHKIYYYYVESIALDGTREKFTPIAKVGPKVDPSESEEPQGSEPR